MVLLESLQDFLFITIGAILGANARFIIYKKLYKVNFDRNSITLVINTMSSFCLGFFLSTTSHISPLNYTYKLGLFFSIGLLGSLSTFSTFIYDLYELFIALKFARAFKLFINSLILGILAFVVGILLALQ